MTQVEAVQIWLAGAEDAWDTVEALRLTHRLHHALFFSQLYLEKILKALTYHLTDDHPLAVHDLVLLCKKINISLTNDQKKDLKEISTFNITARYPEHKQALYKKVTPEFATIWLQKSLEYGKFFKTFLSK